MDVSITNNKSKLILAFLQIKVVNGGATCILSSEKNQGYNYKKIMTEAMSMVKFSS